MFLCEHFKPFKLFKANNKYKKAQNNNKIFETSIKINSTLN